MKHVIVLGYRKGIDDAITRRGLAAIHVVEKYKPNLAGRAFRLVASLEDTQEVLRAALDLHVEDVIGVITAHEQGVFSAAALRHCLDTVGDRNYGQAVYFRDKFLQKSLLPGAIRRATCVYVTPTHTFDELAELVGVPFVVKPANGYGTLRTAIVEHRNDLDALFHRDQRTTGLGRSDVSFVAESYIEGTEIHVDGIWQHGTLWWSSVGEYFRPVIACTRGAQLADYILSPTQGSALLVQQAQRFAAACLEGLAAPDCVFHLEAFHTADGLVFGECAARLAGAKIPEIIGGTHGVDLYDAVVATALDEAAADAITPKPPALLFAYVYLGYDIALRLSRPDFERRFIPRELQYPAPGDQPGLYGRVGYAILADESQNTLRRRIAAVLTVGGDTDE